MTDATPRRALGFLVLALLLITVLALALSGVLYLRQKNLTDDPFSLSNAGQVIPSDQARHQAVAVAEQFCLRMDAVDGSDTSGYVDRVSELLTTRQKAKFTSGFGEFEKLGVDKSLRGEGTIKASAVSDMDTDSATVLVAHDSTVTTSSGTTERHYRWTVTLRKVSGKWLVDDFNPVS